MISFGCWVAIVAPLVIALLAMRRPHWYPVADLAQYELQVRDVGTRHSPLVGLAGRIGPFFDPGSHPGPISFWMLAPLYRLLGASSWAFEAAAVSVHALAGGLVLWMARRRGGLSLVVGVAAVLAVLVHYYGGQLFIEPWNPYLPVLWWVVLLFAVWSVIDHDLAMLPVAVLAGSFCAQTHLPYVGLVGGLAAFLAAAIAIRLAGLKRRGEPLDPGRRLLGWTLGSALLGVVLWLPPVIDQIWGRGNLSRIRDSLSDPTNDLAPLSATMAELLRNLDPVRLVLGQDVTGEAGSRGISWSAVVFLVGWAVAAIVALNLGSKPLVRLHAVVAASLVLAAISVSRIYGVLWWYLFLWARGLAMLMALALVWTAVVAIDGRLTVGGRNRWGRIGLGATATVLVLASAAGSLANVDTKPARPDLSANLGIVTRQTVGALRSGHAPGGGGKGPYLVRWVDRVTIGSQGFGLVNELERAGFRVGVDEGFGVGAGTHRVLPLAKAVAVVELVTGPDIAEWDGRPGALRVGYVDPRTPAEARQFERLTRSVEQQLRAVGLGDVAAGWAGSMVATSLDSRIPRSIHDDMIEVLALPTPVAVYVLRPADAA